MKNQIVLCDQYSRFTKVQNNIKVSIRMIEDIKAAIRTYSGLGVNKSKEGLKNLEETFNQEYPHINFSWEGFYLQ